MNQAARNTQMSNGVADDSKQQQQQCKINSLCHFIVTLESLIKQKYSNNKNAFSGPLHQKNENGGAPGKQNEGSNSKAG